MTRYRNVNSGAVVSVRDDKVLDSSWETYDGSTESDKGYAGMTAADLKAEIDKRNEGREGDSRISAKGKKADLAAALTADDEAGEQDDEGDDADTGEESDSN